MKTATLKRYIYIIYAFLAVLGVSLFGVGISWAIKGKLSEEIVYKSAVVTVSEETRREYIMGEPLNTAGVSISVQVDEETALTPELEDCTIEADTATAGTKPVIVSWQEENVIYRGYYEITVYAVRHIDIRPMTLDSKLVYEQNETEFDESSIEIWADLAAAPLTDEFEKPSEWQTVVRLTSEQFTVSTPDMGKPGIHWATVQCAQVSGGFNYAVEGVAIDTSQAATVYGLGETFKPAGVAVTVTDKDNRTAGNLLGTHYIGNYQYSTPELDEIGPASVEITYGDAKAEYGINVYRQAFECTNVRAESSAESTLNFYWTKGATTADEGMYKFSWVDETGVCHAQTATWGHYGDHITMWAYNNSLSGVDVYYNDNYSVWFINDGNGKRVWEERRNSEQSLANSFEICYSYSLIKNDNNDYRLKSYANVNLSQLEAVKHGVDAKSISLHLDDVVTVFDQNGKFSYDGLTVTAELWNGGTRELSASEYQVSVPALNHAGVKTVTVSYGNPTEGNQYDVLKANYEITVKGYALDLTDVNLELLRGDLFTIDGLKLNYYDENGVTLVNVPLTLVNGADTTILGKQTIEVSATIDHVDYTFEYEITIVPEFTLAVDITNVKTEYLVNGTVSFDGLIVNKTDKKSGEVSQLTNYDISTPDMSTIGVKDITVTYEGVTAGYQIYAIPDVPWETHKLDFGNTSGTGETLEIFVTDRPASSDSTQNSTTKAWYLLKNAKGDYEMYELTYQYTANGWQSNFISEGVEESLGGAGEYIAQINGLTFTADAAYWHQRIIGWVN